jgi:hypothetical protein
LATNPALRRLSAAIPSSPAISNKYKQLTRGVSKQYTSLVKKSGAKNPVEAIRNYVSHVEAVYTVITILEAFGILRATFPGSFVESSKLKDYGTFSYPTVNLGVLFSSIFWAPTTLWLVTSVVIPLGASYFFNLTFTSPRPASRRPQPLRKFDPLTFAIAKGLTTWFIYSPGASFHLGLYSEGTVRLVQNYLYGGYFGQYVGSAIGALLSIYDHISYK